MKGKFIKSIPNTDYSKSYFQQAKYRTFREEMLKRIDKDKITNSFIELRELGASIRGLLNERNRIDDILLDIESKSQIKSEKHLEPPVESFTENQFSSNAYKNEVKKGKNLEINIQKKLLEKKTTDRLFLDQNKLLEKKTTDELFSEQKNEENLKKILGNLEHYLFSNLKEIKDFKDAMAHQEIGLQKGQSFNKFPDESYENTPLANNLQKDRSMFLRKITNLEEENEEGLLKNLDKLSEEISLIENKANQMEIGKLIDKIKNMALKEEGNLQMIEQANIELTHTLSNLIRFCFYAKVLISPIFDDGDMNRDSLDYINSYNLKEEFIGLSEENISFYHLWHDKEPFFQFEYIAISDIIQIFNNHPNSNLVEEEKRKKLREDYDERQFSGFKIKFWSQGILQTLYLKCQNFDNLETLDAMFFTYNIRKTLKPKEFLYKNPKLGYIFNHNDELGGRMSKIKIPKFHTNLLNLNLSSEAQILGSGAESPPFIHQKKSILNWENYLNNNNTSNNSNTPNLSTNLKKKKVTHFHVRNSNTFPVILSESNFPLNEDNKQSEAFDELLNDNDNINDNINDNNNINNINNNNDNNNNNNNNNINNNNESINSIHSFDDDEENFQIELHEKPKKNKVKDMSALKKKLQKLDLIEKKHKIIREEKLKEPNYRFLKAQKNLSNGYIFLKYGKLGDPHERLIAFKSENKKGLELECGAFNVKNSNKKTFDLDKMEKVLFGREGTNFQRFNKVTKDKNLENLSFSLVFKGNKRLDLEAGTETLKNGFLDSLEFILSEILNKT